MTVEGSSSNKPTEGNLGQSVADASGNQSDNPNEPQSTYEPVAQTQADQAKEYQAYEPSKPEGSKGSTGPTAPSKHTKSR